MTVSAPQHCRDLVAQAVRELGKLDVLVVNAVFQMSHETLEEVSDEEWDHTLATNLSAMFHLVKAALPHAGPGASIIGSSLGELRQPSPSLATASPRGRCGRR